MNIFHGINFIHQALLQHLKLICDNENAVVLIFLNLKILLRFQKEIVQFFVDASLNLRLHFGNKADLVYFRAIGMSSVLSENLRACSGSKNNQ